MTIISPPQPKSSGKRPQPRASTLFDGPSAVCNPPPPASIIGILGLDPVLSPSAPVPVVSSNQNPIYGSYDPPYDRGWVGEVAGTGKVTNDGTGDHPEHKCGCWHGVKCSTDGHDPRKWQSSCDSYRCPTCFDKAAHKDAVDGAERVYQGKAKVRYRFGVYHYTISPPPELWDTDDRKLRKAVMKHLHDHSHNFGGALVYHRFRLNDEGKRLYDLFLGEDAGASNSLDNRKWAWWRSRPNRYDLVRVSPHFHFVGGLYIVPNSDKFHVATGGWVYKKISDRWLPQASVVEVLKYVLNHKTLIDGLETTTWIGWCAKNKLGYTEVKTEVEELCPACGKARHQLPEIWFGADGRIKDKPMYNGEMFGSKSEFIESQPVSKTFTIVREWVYHPHPGALRSILADRKKQR